MADGAEQCHWMQFEIVGDNDRLNSNNFIQSSERVSPDMQCSHKTRYIASHIKVD